MNLQLQLIRKWFEMTESGVKPEDYREITPYWCARFLLWNELKKSKKFWDRRLSDLRYNSQSEIIQYYIEKGRITFKQFDQNIMALGYPKSNDTERILKLEHKGINIREGNPEWGAKPGKVYFVIKHGLRIDKPNDK